MVGIASSVIVAAGLVISFGCMPPVKQTQPFNVDDKASISAAVVSKHDDFKKMTRYSGPNASTDDKKFLVLRGWKPDGGDAIDYQIFASEVYSGSWKFYDHAYDDSGNKMDFIQIEREVVNCNRGSCLYRETFGLNVSREYLVERTASGLKFQVSSNKAQTVFFLPGVYIQAFVDSAK